MDSLRRPITSREDIRRIEAMPYAQAVPLRCTHDIFVRAADSFGERTAILELRSGRLEDAPRRLSYRELLANIRRAANLFRSLGVGEGDAVAILLPAMSETHYALWGAEIAGRACPINFMLGDEHIVELLQAARAKVLVALGPDPDFGIWQKAEAIAARLPDLVLLRAGDGASDAFESQLATQPAALQFERDIRPDDIAACYHTGGTTGAPKLAQHTHGNEVHTSWFAGLFYGLGEGDVLINGFPLFHVAGAFVYGASVFCAGATLLLPPRLGMRHKEFVANYWNFVDRHAATYLAAVPTVIAALLDVAPGAARIAGVKALYTGGSPLPTELAAAFERRYGIPVRNILGMTECAGLVSIEPLALPRTPLSCGLPLPYTEVFAVPLGPAGPRLDVRCPPGESGVVVLRGPHVGPGYTDPARNAGMFEAGGLLVSGDLGHVDAEGRVFLTGRAKDVIIRGAHNIDPSMIEEAFAAHPDVLMCAAVGEPDAYAGELPVVFVVLRPGATATGDQILDAVRPAIAEPAAVPRRITVLDALPTTAIGKIYKPGLRVRAIEQAFAGALRELRPRCTRLDVRGVESAGGLAARISVSASDRDGVAQAIADVLGRFAIPFTLEWID